jgi:hypothetical protein
MTSVRTPKMKSAFLRYPGNHLPVDIRGLGIIITVTTMRNPRLAKTSITVVDSPAIYTDALEQNFPSVNTVNAHAVRCINLTVKVSIPHPPSDRSSVVDVFSFGQRLVQRHSKKIHPVIECTNEEIHLQATKSVM